MTYLEIIGLIAGIITIISIVTWNKNQKIRAFLFLILLIIAFVSGRFFFKSDVEFNENSSTFNSEISNKFKYTSSLAKDIKSIGFLDKYSEITKNIHNSYESDKLIEKFLLNKHPSLATRDGIFLELNIDGPNNRTLRNGDPGDYSSKGGLYTLVDYFEKHRFYLVNQQFGEGGSEYLINRENGLKKKICGSPYFSPNSRFVVTTNHDLEAGYSCNALIIYEKVGNILEEKLNLQDSYGNVRWENDNTFVVEKVDLHYEDESDNFDFVYKNIPMRFKIK